MTDWIQAALSQWQNEGIKLNFKTTLADIQKAEQILDFKFPEDLKELYLIVNGFSNYEWRSNLFSIWSLERIIDEFDPSDDGFIGFCDHSLCVFLLGFHKAMIGVYRHYPSFQKRSPEFVTASFREAIDMINVDLPSLY